MFKRIINKKIAEIKAEIKGEIKYEIKAEIRSELKDICRDLVYEMFDKEGYLQHWGIDFHTRIPTLRKNITDAVIANVRVQFDEIYKSRAKSFIAGEDFIDSVVERIQKKQLNGG